MSYEKLASISCDFFVKLRTLEGFDKSLFNELCNGIENFSKEWDNSEVIPKKVVSLLFDGYSSMVSSADQYGERDEILVASDRLAYLIRKCLT